MFSGIIQTVGTVKKSKKEGKGITVKISKPKTWQTKKGESTNIDGICSTVTDTFLNALQVFYMSETIKKTTVADWNTGRTVNLEQSLRLNDFINGHLVTGHIDTRGEIKEVKTSGDSKILTVEFLPKFARYVVEKGSIAVNGVSLTIINVKRDSFTIALIPYTQKHTNLGMLNKGDVINIEFDLIAKYVERIIRKSP